jgi:hypothetical protein
MLTAEDYKKLEDIVALVNDKSQPNVNAILTLLRKVDSLSLTVKFFGYELARTLAAALPVRKNLAPLPVGLRSKASTQADIASDWVAFWCSELKIPVIFHRKIWELAYVLQAIYEHGSIQPNARGLGFGCGAEPIPSYLAQQGVSVTVTDQAPEGVRAQGWINSREHASSLEQVYHSHLVSRDVFETNVSLKYVDMNNIDEDLTDYDFCWSICAFEHLGSIKHGLDFIENSLKTLRPGGLSVHTTEFNFSNDKETIDNWNTVLFQRRHFLELKERLESKGHIVAPLDFNVGNMPLDKFIDVPPFHHDFQENIARDWAGGVAHIKLCVDGFPSTCFGVIVTKGQHA